MLVGAVYGPSLGFQMGVLTLLLSAFLTGGLGPWLPFQMLGAGWVGLTAGWLPRLSVGGDVAPRRRLLLLAGFGAVWGLLFGALLNLYFWPFAAPGLGTDAGLYWSPDLAFGETVARYARFYLVTSFAHDIFRAVGNAVLVLALGGPILRTLERFRSRFSWEPWVDEDDDGERRDRPERGVDGSGPTPSLDSGYVLADGGAMTTNGVLFSSWSPIRPMMTCVPGWASGSAMRTAIWAIWARPAGIPAGRPTSKSPVTLANSFPSASWTSTAKACGWSVSFQGTRNATATETG